MRIFSSDLPLIWGELDLPLFGLAQDWHGERLEPPVAFSLALDPERLWFVATRRAPAKTHPDARPGNFTPELWKHDVAELFLGDPATGEYLEFNLAANGAWWAAKFVSPRTPSAGQPDFPSHVKTYSDETDPTRWLAAIAVPLAFLEKEISLGPLTTANATFILESPRQIFVTAAKLPGTDPDFHQPGGFTPLTETEAPDF